MTKMTAPDLVDEIVEFMLDNGFPPTVREIEDMTGLSGCTVTALMREAKGRKLMETTGKLRGIMIPGVYYVDERGMG